MNFEEKKMQPNKRKIFHSVQLTITIWVKNSRFYRVMVNTKIEAMMMTLK